MVKKTVCSQKISLFASLSIIIMLADPAVSFAFNLNELNRFYQTKQCQKCDLTYGKILRLNAPNANLVDARCKGINLSDAILDHSDFSGADFTGATFFASDLRNTKFRSANLKGANLIISDLSGADLTNANLSNANLKGANLRGAKMEGADFSGAIWFDWEKCKEGSVGECKK